MKDWNDSKWSPLLENIFMAYYVITSLINLILQFCVTASAGLIYTVNVKSPSHNSNIIPGEHTL